MNIRPKHSSTQEIKINLTVQNISLKFMFGLFVKCKFTLQIMTRSLRFKRVMFIVYSFYINIL